jgi:hypothetical protein
MFQKRKKFEFIEKYFLLLTNSQVINMIINFAQVCSFFNRYILLVSFLFKEIFLLSLNYE